MSRAARLYPECAKEEEEGCFYAPGDYRPIIKDLGKIAVQVDDDDYQGDSRVLYDFGGDQYGVLVFGWGSCSGCDSLQACNSMREIDELIDRLERSIKRGTREEILAWISDDEIQEIKYYCYGDEWEQFVAKVKEVLA